MLYIYNPTPTPARPTLVGAITRYVIEWQARTFTLGLVRADGPPGGALLTHVSTVLGTTSAGLGSAVRTLAHVRCKCTCGQLCGQLCEQSCEQTQTTIIIRS